MRFLAQGPRSRLLSHARGDRAHARRGARGKGVALALRFLGARLAGRAGGRRARARHGQLPARRRPRALADAACPATGRSSIATSGRGSTSGLRGQDGALKYEFRVRPGARPADIRLAYRGAEGLRRDGDRRAADRDRRSACCATRRRWPTRRSTARGVPVESRYVLERRRAATGSRSAHYDPRPRAGHRPGPGLLDAARRHEPRDRQRHRGRRGGQRLRDRLHPVAQLPDDARRVRPHRLGEQQPGRVRHQAESRRHRARLLDVPRRRQLRVGPRHRGRLGGQRLRDGQDDVVELPDHRRRLRPHLQHRQLPALRHRPGRRVHRQAEPRRLRPRLLDVPRRHAARRDVRHRDRRRAQRVRDRRDGVRATSRPRRARSTRPPAAARTPSSPS